MRIGEALLVLLWVFGLVLIEGFWKTVLGVIIFPYAWYVAVEYLFKYFIL